MIRAMHIVKRWCFLGLGALLVVSLGGCSIAYKFNGATIDYSQTKTISITDFPNQAPLVYPSLSQTFTEKLRDLYVKRTKLSFIDQGGDLSISGVIVGYELSPLAVQDNAISSRTKFTITVSVSFVDKANPKNGFENKIFTEFTDFDSGQMFNAIQDQLIEELVERIIKQIYNATVENW